MKTVKCKMTINEIVKNDDGSMSFHATPVISGSDENKEFFKFTPSGSFTLNVVSPDTMEGFKQGDEIYVTLQLANAEATSGNTTSGDKSTSNGTADATAGQAEVKDEKETGSGTGTAEKNPADNQEKEVADTQEKATSENDGAEKTDPASEKAPEEKNEKTSDQ